MQFVTVIYKNRKIQTLAVVKTKVRDKERVRRVVVDTEYMSSTRKREISLVTGYKQLKVSV